MGPDTLEAPLVSREGRGSLVWFGVVTLRDAGCFHTRTLDAAAAGPVVPVVPLHVSGAAEHKPQPFSHVLKTRLPGGSEHPSPRRSDPGRGLKSPPVLPEAAERGSVSLCGALAAR